jgi:isopropylmalate/homocitrate/citramalate synthase
MRVLMFLLRKTYGWKKKKDWISISQFLDGTGLSDRRYAHRALKSLENKNMVVICRDDKKHPTYGFQKDYERWKLPSLSDDTLKCMAIQRERRKRKSASTDDRVSPLQAPTKETLTKEPVKEKEERELSSSLKPKNPETPSSKKKSQETSFAGISYLLSSPNAFKERLKDFGYRLSESRLKLVYERINQMAAKNNDISDQDVESIIMKIVEEASERMRLRSPG